MTRVPERPLPLFGVFRNLPKALPNASFQSFRRNPCRTVLRKVPPVPEASPKVISPKAFFDTPSKQTLRSFLRNIPRVPKGKPKATPQALRSRPERPSGSTLGTRHVFPSAERKPFLRKPPELATRSECLNSKPPPGALRVATCPETHPGRIPNTSRKPRMRREVSK